MAFIDVPPLVLVVRSITIYLALLVALRVFGKREVGQFTLFDLVLVLLVANAVQPAVTGPDTSLGGGLVIIVTLIATNALVAEARRRSGFVRRLLEAPATTLARDGTWIHEAVERERLDASDLEAAIREHGIDSVEEVALAVLEADGSISVVPRDAAGAGGHRHRRVRLVRHR